MFDRRQIAMDNVREMFKSIENFNDENISAKVVEAIQKNDMEEFPMIFKPMNLPLDYGGTVFTHGGKVRLYPKIGGCDLPSEFYYYYNKDGNFFIVDIYLHA